MYEKIIVLGLSHLAYKFAMELFRHGINPEVFDTNVEKSLFLEKICVSNKIRYTHLSKEKLMEFIFCLKEKTLIISVFNMYLIPKKIFDKDNICIINCHRSILPRHAGMYGTTWAIYEQDREAGVTLHYMVPHIDAGDIITTKKTALDDNITAFQLSKKQNDMALEGFNEILEALLNDRIKGIPQDLTKRGVYHHKYDIPNGGFLDTVWDFNKISAFLRSLDYGALDRLNKRMFPKPMIAVDDGKVFSWEKYVLLKNISIFNNEEIYFEGNDIVISKSTGKVRLINVFAVPIS